MAATRGMVNPGGGGEGGNILLVSRTSTIFGGGRSVVNVKNSCF
jgi:hypothetical protein